MRPTLLLAALLTCIPCSISAYSQAQDPIAGIGRMKDIAGAQEKPDPKLEYKIVFDMKSVADSPEDVAPDLGAVAALVNTFRAYGVPADHLHLAAVFHGATLVQLTDDATYKARTGYSTNPNTDLLTKLRQAGVKLMVCGQSALAQGYDLNALSKAAQINLSATVTFVNLQTEGYIKVEE